MRNRANEVFEYIVAFKREHDGNSPTVREIMRACGFGKSTSYVWLVLRFLEGEGRIRLGEYQSRSIEVVGGMWGMS